MYTAEPISHWLKVGKQFQASDKRIPFFGLFIRVLNFAKDSLEIVKKKNLK